MMICAFADDPFPWLEILGRSHPLVLHLPLGLVPAIALLEFGAMVIRRPPPRGAILALAWLCAVAAGLATTSGLLLAGESSYSSTSDTVANHKIAGIVLGSLCLVAAIAACFRNRTPFRLVLLLTFVAMIPAGHLGGTITHGQNFLLEPLTKHRNSDKATNGTGSDNDVDNVSKPVNEYLTVIAPLIERTCSKCHNPDKQKAELLLTTPEGIMKGSENGPVLEPGSPDESLLLARCLLPLDDDDHMPPEDKPQPTAEELEALRKWIAAGAKFE